MPCVRTHQDASNGRAHPLTLIVKSSAVTIVSGCVAHSRSVAFGVSTRALYPTVRRAVSRDNFSVYRGYYARVYKIEYARLFPLSVSVPVMASRRRRVYKVFHMHALIINALSSLLANFLIKDKNGKLKRINWIII